MKCNKEHHYIIKMTDQLKLAVETGRTDVVKSFLSTLQESKHYFPYSRPPDSYPVLISVNLNSLPVSC